MVQPISQVFLAELTLCWQFEDQKDMYLALRGVSVIRKGHFYDADSIFNHQGHHNPCKPQHRLKLLVDPKRTVV